MFTNADLVSSYTRAQALEDGVLVDAGGSAREAGFTIPVALTRAVWEQCVEVPPGVQSQDVIGRLWDVLSMLKGAIRSQRGSHDRVQFSLHLRNTNRAGTPPLVKLVAVCGPSDDATPCITIMLPTED